MGSFNVNAAIKRVDRIIRRYGASAVLRRGSGDRVCTVAIVDYSPAERVGKLINALDRVALISALSLEGKLAPNHLVDTLVTFVAGSDPAVELSHLKLIEPPAILEANGRIIYWECKVRG